MFHSAYRSAFDDPAADEELAAAFRELRMEYGPVSRDDLLPVLLAELSFAPEEATSFRELLGVETSQSMAERLDQLQSHLSTIEAELESVDPADGPAETTERALAEVETTVDAVGTELGGLEEGLAELYGVRDELVARVATLERTLGEMASYEDRLSELELWHDDFMALLRRESAAEDA